MAPPNTPRPAAALAASGPQKSDRLARTIWSTDRPQEVAGQWRDKYGHLHSGAIFKNWSPTAIKALGIHRVVEPDDPAGGAA